MFLWFRLSGKPPLLPPNTHPIAISTDFCPNSSSLAACGGFSHGDILGSGRGWACSVLQNAALRNEFATFFARKDTFTLGVCNGCQFLSHLKELIPGTEAWPTFERNKSEVYEARVSSPPCCIYLSAQPILLLAKEETGVLIRCLIWSSSPWSASPTPTTPPSS